MSRREPRACPGGAMWASPPTKGQADLPHNDRRGRRPRRPDSAAAPRCHSEPVTVSLAWESVSPSGGTPAFCRNLTKNRLRCILHPKDAAINGRRLVTAPRGGDAVFFVLTFHILGHSISIRIQKLKSKNRHSDK